MLIGISGKLQSGKDTTALLLRKIAFDEGINFETKRFASGVKQVVSMLTRYSMDDLERIEVKNAYLPDEWNDLNLMRFIGNSNDARMTVRQMLQKVGTDAMRNHLHTNVWVNALLKDYASDKNWIITDVRFPNEFNAIHERGGYLIRINRGNQERGENEHASEFALDSETRWDYLIQNDGSLKELQFKVIEIWKNLISRKKLPSISPQPTFETFV